VNTDIIEFESLSKTVKTEILEEHVKNLQKKQEEINETQSLIQKHLNITNLKLTGLKQPSTS
jgi:hypothetical protein